MRLECILQRMYRNSNCRNEQNGTSTCRKLSPGHPILTQEIPKVNCAQDQRYRCTPSANTIIAMPMKVAPRGRPTFLNVANPAGGFDGCIVVERRKSCVTATPIDANESDVRNHAK